MNEGVYGASIDRAQRDREVVQRTAELLTSNLSLEELFHAVCSLLARFVDASMVFVALKEREGARIAYMLENGVVETLENRHAHPQSRTAHVMRTGESVLKRRHEDWTEGRLALNLPGQPQHDERVSAIFVPLKFGTQIIGVLSVQSVQSDAYDEADVALLQTCALYLSVRIHQARLETHSARMENIASTDVLTSVPNRRSFNERFDAEWRRAVRRNVNLSVMLIDIDFFKAFNDTYGHVAGDAALQQVATALASCVSRSEDFFARFGGEEFVAVLPDTKLEGALAIAERMRKAVYDLGIAHSGSLLGRLTISAGVATKSPSRGVAAEQLIEDADAALYQAKRSGRNRVAAENYRSDTPPAYPSKAYRQNLPDVRTNAIGRSDQLRQLRKLLRGSRLLTIAGPPGIGKSLEAVETARREIGRFADGTYYIDCSTLTSERYLATKIASVVSVPDTAAVTSKSSAVDFLHSKRALLILDNCDHIMGAVAETVTAILEQARHIRTIVTARTPLLIGGEVCFTLPSLPMDDAVALFYDRARAAGRGDALDRELVEKICTHLDGLPRAILLAAAQLRAVSIGTLMERMPDRAALQLGSGRNLLEWAYTVLAPSEQQLLRACSVFSGGAREDALASVNGEVDALEALVDSTLIARELVAGEVRYVIPGTVRTFCVERSRAMGEWRRFASAHARYFRERARELEASYSTKQWRPLLEAMMPELDNIRTALHFTVSQGNDVELGSEMTCDLINYWEQLGRSAAGREWIEALLARTDIAFTKQVRAKLLSGLSRLDSARSKVGLDSALASVQLYRELGEDRGLSFALFEAAAACMGIGDFDGADPYLEEALMLAQRNGDARRTADVLNGMALAAQWRGRLPQARELMEKSLTLFRELDDDRGVASLLGNLGDHAATQGDFDRASSLSRQSLAIFERLHDAQCTGWQLMNLGSFELRRGNTEAARSALRRSLELVREYQDDWLSANCLDAISRLAILEKDWRRALRLAGFADYVLETIGVPRQPPDQIHYEQVTRQACEVLGEACAVKELQDAQAMKWSEALNEALRV